MLNNVPFTPSQVSAIVHRHLREKVPVTDICDTHGISPGDFYLWKRQVIEETVSQCLVEDGIITERQLRRATEYQQEDGHGVLSALIELELINSQVFMTYVAKQPGIASVDILNYDMDPAVVRLIPRDLAVERKVVPMDRLGRRLTLAMAFPMDDSTIHDVAQLTGLTTKPILADADDILWIVNRIMPEDKADSNLTRGIPELMKPDTSGLRPLKASEVEGMIAHMDSLPLAPGTIHMLRHALAHGTMEPAYLTQIASTDPLMTARILSLANSKRPELSGQVYSVRQAVNLLGPQNVSLFAAAAESVRIFENWRRFDLHRYWTDALCCATAATLIAETCAIQEVEVLHTAGLLHDIGRVALCELLPEHYEKIGLRATGLDLLDLEREMVGLTHTQAGYALAKQWQLPNDIAECIRYHHFTEKTSCTNRFVAVIAIANVFADLGADHDDISHEVLNLCAAPMNLLGIGKHDLRDTFNRYVDRMPNIGLNL